jgi:hypothetical protein
VKSNEIFLPLMQLALDFRVACQRAFFAQRLGIVTIVVRENRVRLIVDGRTVSTANIPMGLRRFVAMRLIVAVLRERVET